MHPQPTGRSDMHGRISRDFVPESSLVLTAWGMVGLALLLGIPVGWKAGRRNASPI